MNKNELLREDLNPKKIAKGGFGEVYLITYKGKKYAMKKISKQIIISEKNQAKKEYLKNMINREIDINKKLSQYENSVRFYFNYEDDNNYIFILEYCEENLSEFLKRKKKLTSAEILYIMKGLNKVFTYMVNNNIVHRDIKPDNILIKYIDKERIKFIPKLTDYGIARKLDDGKAVTLVGTPMYEAPEIKIKKLKYDNKCDLYSIGVLMYELYFNDPQFTYHLNKGKLKDCEDKNLDDLIKKLIVADPKKRISWEDYFNHPFFKTDEEKKDSNNRIKDMEIDDDKEHEIIKLYDYILEKILHKNNEEKEKLKKQDDKQFIPIDECIKSKDDSLFILGILAVYLKKIGISVLIRKDDPKRDYDLREYHKNIFQIICNGYILKKKYLIHFDLSEDRIHELVNDPIERCKFNEKFQNLILKTYNLKEEEVLLTNIKREEKKFTIVMVIKSNINIEMTKDKLIAVDERDKDLRTLSKIEIENMIPELILSTSMLNPLHNNKKSVWNLNEKRGGEDYLPPLTWINYAINIDQCFNDENNDWISHEHRPGEWCVAYCGFKTKKTQQIYANKNDFRHDGQKVGIGVYCPSNPKKLEEDSEVIEVNGSKYKVGFMLRVKPGKIRACSEDKNMWVVNGNDNEFRPYGILVKTIK